MDCLSGITGGGTPSREVPEYWDGTIPWASVKDLSNRNQTPKEYISIIGLESSSSNLIPAGTCIIGTRMAVGVVKRFSEPVAINQDLKALFPNEKLAEDYLYYFIVSKQPVLQILGIGSTVSGISLKDLRKLPIPLPPLPEQKKIAEILSTWDQAIEKLEKLIALKEKRKKGLMQQLLTGKKRLPGFGKPVEKNGDVPEGWERVKLRDVLIGSTTRNSDMKLKDVRSVNKVSGMQPMENRFIGSDISKYKVVTKNYYAYNPMRINIGSINKWTNESKCLVSPDYVVFRCDNNILNHNFFDFIIGSHRWNQFIEREGNGSVRVRIYLKDLGRMMLILPEMNEQHQIATILSCSEVEIRCLKKQLSKYVEQKKGLMQKLLTGEVRVDV
jgi:type I restriction enzyme S subunit